MPEMLTVKGEPPGRRMLEVWRNGEYVCRAGVYEFGLACVILNQIRRPMDSSFVTDEDEKAHSEHIHLSIGGMHNDQHVYWGEEKGALLKAGDEITIKVVESDTMDAPKRKVIEE